MRLSHGNREVVAGSLMAKDHDPSAPAALDHITVDAHAIRGRLEVDRAAVRAADGLASVVEVIVDDGRRLRSQIRTRRCPAQHDRSAVGPAGHGGGCAWHGARAASATRPARCHRIDACLGDEIGIGRSKGTDSSGAIPFTHARNSPAKTDTMRPHNVTAAAAMPDGFGGAPSGGSTPPACPAHWTPVSLWRCLLRFIFRTFRIARFSCV